jgi:myo-inositol 2-dehydrogenase/D-chiro-inositol 1-dehydrogenase
MSTRPTASWSRFCCALLSPRVGDRTNVAAGNGLSAEVRVGLAGCGRLAQQGWLPAFGRVDGVRLTAVADPEPGRCRSAEIGARTHTSVAELIDAGGIDALILATPVYAHLPDARRAAAAGLPCLVEKPPATDLREALQLAALEPPPAIGFNRRFVPPLQALHRAVPSAGPLRLELRLHYRRRSWSAYTVEDEALIDLGPHLIDLVRWLSAADAEAVRAHRLTHQRAQLELRLEDGRGTASLDCATDRHFRELVAIRDGRGRNVGRVATGGWLGALTGRLRPPAVHPLVESLARELEHFTAAVRGAPPPPLASASDGAAVMAAIEAARRSAAAGGAWEPIPRVQG